MLIRLFDYKTPGHNFEVSPVDWGSPNHDWRYQNGDIPRHCERFAWRLILAFGLSISMNVAQATAAPSDSSGDSVTVGTAKHLTLTRRTLRFPDKQSLGAVFVGTLRPDLDMRGTKVQVAGARGIVTVTMQPGQDVFLEANRRIFQNPELIDQISPEGLDYISMGFTAMDDREEGACDRALQHIDHLTYLKGVEVDRSDADDSGLANVKGLKHLKCISCFQSCVNGEFFKVLPALPDFVGLNCSFCMIKPSNYKYLARVPKLSYLNVSRTGLDVSGMVELSKCTKLKTFRAQKNPKFDDNCVRYLLPLTELEWLDLRDTKVTMSGLRSLRSLQKLTRIMPPERLNSPENVAELGRIFPKKTPVTYFAPGGGHMSSETERIFAPLR
jgi:hypothetical protein